MDLFKPKKVYEFTVRNKKPRGDKDFYYIQSQRVFVRANSYSEAKAIISLTDFDIQEYHTSMRYSDWKLSTL